MPNVEIHGLDKRSAGSMRVRVWNKFANTPFVKDMVVTIYHTDVADESGISQPFLRLVTTRSNDNPLILKALQELDMDVEHIDLEGFWAKKK